MTRVVEISHANLGPVNANDVLIFPNALAAALLLEPRTLREKSHGAALQRHPLQIIYSGIFIADPNRSSGAWVSVSIVETET